MIATFFTQPYFFAEYFPHPYFNTGESVAPVTPATRSAKLYQERKRRQTLRRPTPRFAPTLGNLHVLPMFPPYPLVEAIREQGKQPPDAGRTEPWPRG